MDKFDKPLFLINIGKFRQAVEDCYEANDIFEMRLVAMMILAEVEKYRIRLNNWDHTFRQVNK